MIPDALRAMRAAIRCDMAYMEPTFGPTRDAQGYLEVVDGMQHFAIAGTNSPGDVLRDISLIWRMRAALGMVRKGFADAWDPFRDAGIDGLGLTRTMPLILEGHSLGAVIAQYLSKWIASRMQLAGFETFGCPTGWQYKDAMPRGIDGMNWKNRFDIVAGRPWLIKAGYAPGTWVQIDDGEIKPELYHPSNSSLHPFTAAENHKLQGENGYVYQLGKLAEAQGRTRSWREEPEVVRWFEAVEEWKRRKAA